MKHEAWLKAAGVDCANCPYAKDGQPNKPVMPVGPHEPDAVLVGESPGREEVRAGEPFVGPTGQELNLLLVEAGLVRERLLLVNVVACQPTEPKRLPQLRKAVKCCRPFVREVLRGLPKDTPVALMGAAAVLSVTGAEKGSANARGFINYEWDLTKACPEE